MEKKVHTVVISGLPANTSQWVDLQVMETLECDSEELRYAIDELLGLFKNSTNVYFGSDVKGFRSAVLIPSPKRFLAFKIRSITSS